LKIAVNFNTTNSPTGGGNGFVNALTGFISARGHSVISTLNESDVDLILIIDPRSNHQNLSFSVRDIIKYVRNTNPNALIVHRINECDERKNTKYMNRKLRLTNYMADSTVYVGTWLKTLNLKNSRSREDFDTVILNGSDSIVFNSEMFLPWTGIGPIKLVTHHWSSNPMKGWDIYSKLDFLLSNNYWKKKFAFTFIGNLPKGVVLKNSNHISPIGGVTLAREISKHHGYVTASINEPGGNHQNEGALCGLPLLFRDSGCMPEYCSGYGISFNEDNLDAKLIEFHENYSSLVKLMPSYPHTASVMTAQYLKHFDFLLQNKAKIISERNLKKNLISLYRLYFPI
jgi:hypothetical protein